MRNSDQMTIGKPRPTLDTIEFDLSERTYTLRFDCSSIENLNCRCYFFLFAAYVVISINDDRGQVSVLAKKQLTANSIINQFNGNSNTIYATIPEFDYVMTWKK